MNIDRTVANDKDFQGSVRSLQTLLRRELLVCL